jgi:hypothetical protein
MERLDLMRLPRSQGAPLKVFIVFGMAVGFSGCSSVRLPSTRTAAEQFAGLRGNRDKSVAKNFYELGESDTIKRLYWAQRQAQETGGVSESQPATRLQRKYVVLPVPEHVEPDGTIKEANNQVIEVVQ